MDQGLSLIAGPLYRLYKKNVEFVWGEEQMRATEELKKAVMSAPILKAPEYSEVD